MNKIKNSIDKSSKSRDISKVQMVLTAYEAQKYKATT